MNTSQTTDWQKRAEKAEDELGDWRATFPGRNASEAVQLLADAHAELERVQKQAAAMREAMLEAAEAAGCTWLEQQIMLAGVLQNTDAGANYVSKEDVKRLVEACKLARSALDKLMGDSDLPNDDSLEMKACQALSAAIAKATGA